MDTAAVGHATAAVDRDDLCGKRAALPISVGRIDLNHDQYGVNASEPLPCDQFGHRCELLPVIWHYSRIANGADQSVQPCWNDVEGGIPIAKNRIGSQDVTELRWHGALSLPSLARSGRDYDDVAHRIVKKGCRVIRPEPRGVRGSVGSTKALSLHDIAGDFAAVLDQENTGPVLRWVMPLL